MWSQHIYGVTAFVITSALHFSVCIEEVPAGSGIDYYNLSYNLRRGIVDSDPTTAEGVIKEYILDRIRYKRDVRPRTAIHPNTTINMGFALRHIREIDEKMQTVTINGWLRMSWLDQRLEWSKLNTSFDKNSFLRVFPTDIWLPDVTLYNNFYADEVHRWGWTYALVDKKGVVTWVPPVVYTAYCHIDLRSYPFDVQECKLILGSWTHDGYSLDLQPIAGSPHVDVMHADPNVMWSVEKATASRVKQFYPCCPEPYVTMEYTFLLHRQHAYYSHTMLLPAAITSFLSLLTFWLPPDSGEKMSFGSLNLIVICMFFIYTALQVPISEGHVPVILRFYAFSLILVSISLVLATVVLKMFHRAPYRKKVVRPVPNWIRTLVLNGVGKVVCLHRERYHSLDDRNKMDSDMSGMNEEVTTEDSNPESDGTSTFRRFVLDKQLSQTAEENMIADWQLVAIVIDRVFFSLYSLAFVVATCVIISYE